MRTHYYKTKTKHSQKMPTAFHGFLYNQLPSEQLFTVEDVKFKIGEYVKTSSYLLRDILDLRQISKINDLIESAIDELVTDGMGIKEIHWSKIEKLTRS